MQIRVKNTNTGGRGFHLGDDGLVFVDAGATATFAHATAEERDHVATIKGLKVQSRQGMDGDWTDHFQEEMPTERPWLAIATDASGGNFKPLTDVADVWYVGTAVAGERPEAASAYTWTKVGGADVAPVVEPEPAPVNDTPTTAELVEGNMPDVIAAITPANAMDIGIAEEARVGGPRKGVMKAVEDALATVDGSAE